MLAGFANGVVHLATLGNASIPEPFHGWDQSAAFEAGNWTAAAEGAYAIGVGASATVRAIVGRMAVGGVTVAPILAPLAGGAAGSLVAG